MLKIFLFSSLLFLHQYAFTQTAEIKNLIFEGGGVRGIAYCGVIKELEKANKISTIEKVGGTSAGAITALLLSLGYNSAEIENIIYSTRIKSFNDGRLFFVGGMLRMTKRYGWYRGEKFSKWLSEIIKKKTGNSEITFSEMGKLGFKDLYITGTCLNKQNLIIFSKKNYPNMKIKDAVRISMSIPLYFTAVFIDSSGTIFKKHRKDKTLDVVVDGGIIGNYPIFMFDSVYKDSTNKIIRIHNWHTLGIRLDTEEQILVDKKGNNNLATLDVTNLNEYLTSFYNLIIEKLNRTELSVDDWKRTISVSTVGISPRIKRLPKIQKDSLVNSGTKAALEYLNSGRTK